MQPTNFQIPQPKRHCPKCGLSDTDTTRMMTLDIQLANGAPTEHFCLQCLYGLLRQYMSPLVAGPASITPEESSDTSSDDFPRLLDLKQ